MPTARWLPSFAIGFWASICLILLLIASSPAQDLRSRARLVRMAEDAVIAFLKSKGDPVPPPVRWLPDPDLRAAFPKHVFFALHYAPSVDTPPPKGFGLRNIVAVGWSDGKPQIEVFNDDKSLAAFFRTKYVSATGKLTPEEAEAALLAWLRLAVERYRRGPAMRFVYAISLSEFVGTGRVPQVRSITGKAIVASGGQGEIQATIDFDEGPGIARILERSTVRPPVTAGR